MKTYIFSLLAASLAAAVVELLAPKGQGDRVVSHIRMLAGLFLLAALVTPLREGIELLRSAADGDLSSRVEAIIPSEGDDGYGEIFGDSLTAISAAEVEAWVVQTLEREFGIPAEGCTVWVGCAYDGETLTVTEVRISLHSPYTLSDPHPLETYYGDQLGCPCYVTVD